MAADGMGWGSFRRDSMFGEPPQDGYTASVETEQHLLSGLLMNPRALEMLPDGFSAKCLVGQDHADLFEAIRHVVTENAEATFILPAVETLLPHLAGAEGYIRQLAAAVISSRAADIRLYATRIQDMERRHRLMTLSRKIRQALEMPEDGRQPTDAILNFSIATLEDISMSQRAAQPAVMIGDAAMAAIKAGEAAAERGDGLSGLSIGFSSLDSRIGGMEGGSVYILAGRPGSGKTSLGLQCALRLASGYSETDRRLNPERAKKVAAFSLEMKAPQLGRRALALVSGVNAKDIRSGQFTRDSRLADAVLRGQKMLEGMPLLIEDEAGLTVQAIHMRAKAAKRRLGGLDLLLIDHAHIVRPTDSAMRQGPTAGMTEISHGVKWLSKTLDVPVLFLAQLSRSVEQREDKRPNLSDLRQAGAFEEDADVVMFVYREEYYTGNVSDVRRVNERDEVYFRRIEDQRRHAEENKGKAEIIFAKTREGEPGTEELRFDGRRTRFYEEGDGEGRA